jgi:uncharacterized protein
VREPHRTCIACRRVLPQRRLLRLARAADGSVQPDPGRRGGRRGAYVCAGERCLDEALRRDRWTRVFRAPSVMRPETVDQVRTLLAGMPDSKASGQPAAAVIAAGARKGVRTSVEGGR